ncbi:hypothetical protein WJX72_005388 [[Myrmecia] bisecta]|uniref:GS catalytic domain-containing protein n=1 Tax=[Myrmecia] bisecta TaxID=41462 RepID=A0AAW1PDV2_9CHLO
MQGHGLANGHCCSGRCNPGGSVLHQAVNGEGEVKFVRLLWVDTSGIRRCRVVPRCKWEEVCKSGLGLATAAMALQAWADVLAPLSGLTVTGELRLMPQSHDIRQLPWHPAHAISCGELHESPGKPSSLCPRAALQRALDAALDQHGLEFQVGFETEFFLLRRDLQASQPPSLTLDGPDVVMQVGQKARRAVPEPVDMLSYCSSRALDACSQVLDDIMDALEQLGIPVVQFHAESAPGQFEIVASHGDPFMAASDLVMTRETIACIAQRHGLLASFLPKLFKDGCASGCHCHISIIKDGENLMNTRGSEHGLSDTAAAFLAGLLHHLPGLMCFTLGSVNSFERIKPSSWSGSFQVWGVQNKEATLRLCGHPGVSGSANVELKALDATANPYVALAAIITAGLQGITSGARLPPPVNVDPALLSRQERQDQGITALPANMGEALAALKADTALVAALEEVLGADLVKAVRGVRAGENDHFSKASFEEVVAEVYDRY